MAAKNKKKKKNKSLFNFGFSLKKQNKKQSAEEPVRETEELSETERMLRENREMYAEVPHSDNFTEEDYRKSVESFTEKDVAQVEKTEAPKKKKKKKLSPVENGIQISLISICAGVALVCLYLLVQNIYGKIRGNEVYSDTDFDRFTLTDEDESFNHPTALAAIESDTPMLSMFERIVEGKSVDNTNKNNSSDKVTQMKTSLSALQSQYPEVYGWIYVPDTKIDYPIMKGADNDYYLDHVYTGESLPIGSIFADYHVVSPITDNYNTVIYGHNVVTGAMFHDMTKFLDESFMRDETHKIYIYTMDGVYIYRVLAIYDTTDTYYYYRTSFNSEEDFLSFAKEVVSNSEINMGETFSSGDTMLTLSTCTNGTDVTSSRYALHAKLVEVIK